MGFLKKLLGGGKKATQQISTAGEFWDWFLLHEQEFYKSIKKHQKPEDTLNEILEKLEQVYKPIYALVGMLDENVAELVLTVDGEIKSVAFIDDIVAAAPPLPHWKFTSLKPAVGFDHSSIEMNGLTFNSEKIKFYTTDNPEYPDDIEINIVHEDYSSANHNDIGNGSLIFLDNAIGELKMITQIDNVDFTAAPKGTELIPIQKLNDYLLWREKEFVEKYDEIRYDASQDEFSVYEAEDNSGRLMLAVINQPLLLWEHKASHPWMMAVEVKFTGGENGMPDEVTYGQMNELEDELLKMLANKDGYLYLGRETYNNERFIYFACREFRNSSRIADATIRAFHHKMDIRYSIFKDKYWRALKRFVG